MIEKLSAGEKAGYALGDMAANFVFQALLALQLSYYTDTFGLTAAQAGTLFLVVGLIAAAFNPVMGVIADRTSTRWGKFRPWLLWTAVPFGIIGVLTFTTPSMSLSGKLIYAWVTYLLLRLIYAVNNVPYASLTAVMTGDPDERTSIASWRQVFANAAGFIVQSLAIPMVLYFGHGSSARGYQITMGLLSLLSVVFFIAAFACTKERIQPDPQQRTSLGQDLGDLFRNGPWIVLFLVTTFYFAAIAMRGSVMLPYFKYLAGNQDLFSWFNGFGLVALIVGVMCSTGISVWLGKRRLFILSMTLTGIFNLAVLFLPPTATVAIVTSEVLRQFAYGTSGPLIWAMMGDVADYGEWKTGRRATGTVTAAVVFALWVGLAIGGAIAGWLFSYYGYVSNAVQTAHALEGIRLTAGLYSGLLFFATAACLFFYPISRKINQTISDELAGRRKLYAKG
ncbi:MAG TPA: MFS transporter [Acidobacteriaceae bacterium]|jgi:glycoside/pentoside/hexuronide:cation symporter, GPH family|nr:MFS transporter [Acidobacteriaceae bacterium]